MAQPPQQPWNQPGQGPQGQPGEPGPLPQYGKQPEGAPASQPGDPATGATADRWGTGTAAPARPGTVLGGAVMTYIGSTFFALIGLLVAIVGLIGSSMAASLPQLGQQSGLDPQVVTGIAIGAGLVMLAWGVALIVLAVFAAQRRSNGARVALTVLGAIGVLGNIVSVVTGNWAAIIPLAYIAVAVALFWIGQANEWYRAKPGVR